MTTTWTDFLTSGTALVIPLAFAAIVLSWILYRRGSPSPEHWRALGRFESLALPLFIGLGFGPQVVTQAFAGMTNSNVSITVERAMGVVVLLVATLLCLVTIRALSKMQGYQWIAVGFLGYTLGVWINVILRQGEPFRSMFT